MDLARDEFRLHRRQVGDALHDFHRVPAQVVDHWAGDPSGFISRNSDRGYFAPAWTPPPTGAVNWTAETTWNDESENAANCGMVIWVGSGAVGRLIFHNDRSST